MAYNITKKNVMEAIKNSVRLDGRKPFDIRDVEIKLGVSNQAEGSVAVKIGKTEVMAGIKMDVSEPYTDHEGEGTMMTSLDLLPLSSPSFEYGPPSVESIEMARIIDRGIRESGFVDFEKLCIKRGEKVWSLFIDIATINDDGNLIDAGALASVIALLTAKMPKYNEAEDRVEFGEFTEKSIPLDLEKMPLTATFFKVGEKVFLDPTREEDDSTEGRITFEVSMPKKEAMINAMQKGGEAVFSIEEVSEMAEESVKVFKKLKALIDQEIEKSGAKRSK